MSKKRAGNKIRQKTDMMPGVNIISRKASVASFNGAWGSGRYSESLSRDSRGRSPLRNFLDPQELRLA